MLVKVNGKDAASVVDAITAKVVDLPAQLRVLRPGSRLTLDALGGYLRDDLCEVLEGWWTDAGTFESLLRAANLVAEGGANRTE